MTEQIGFNSSLESLKSFAEKTSLKELLVPTAKRLNSDSTQKMEYGLAEAWLETTCRIRTMAMISSQILSDCLRVNSEGSAPSLSDSGIFQETPSWLKVFFDLRTTLDETMSHPKMLDIERQQWQLPMQIDSIRNWLELMSTVGGRLQTSVVQIWAMILVESREIL